MSLSLALNTARSSLAATTSQINISGRNIAGAGDPTYSRKIAESGSTADGGARIVSIRRATDLALYYTMLGATSSAAGQKAVLAGLDRISSSLGDAAAMTSPAGKLSALSDALQQHASHPDDPALAQGVVTKAQDMAKALNDGSRAVLQVRSDADGEIASAVVRTNSLLSRFEALNTSIVKGSVVGADVTTELDQRDGVLAQLSEEMGVHVVARANNDLALYTDGGVTLFDTTARAVTFKPTATYTAATPGHAVVIDGIPVTGPGATMPLRAGNLVGLTTLRDDVALSYQKQLDELARGLVENFTESDQLGGGGIDRAGLFTYAGGPGVPAPGTVVAGLAGSIRVNAAVDPAQGGRPERLRDGGINGPAYRYNSGAAAYSDRLQDLADGLGAARAFDSSAGLAASSSLKDYAAASIGWVEGRRQTASNAAEYNTALLARASEALSNATGVNMDDEYALQLQLEQSYAASAKLISVVSEMFQTLLDSVR
jgi:flagellar hook-associated protein 1 FlgK